MDIRYRVYGSLTSRFLPYRTSRGGGLSDFITVGKIDNVDILPYSKYYSNGNVDNYSILKDFHWRNEGIKLEGNNFVYDPNNTKLGIILEQFNIEAGTHTKEGYSNIINMVRDWRINHPNEPIVFEITNEPNLYPYVSPALYAFLYIKWVNAIKEVEPNALIMNGGLWIYDGLPSAILENIDLIKVNIKNTLEYYQKFYAIIEKFDIKKYTPDILNLHFYPYIDKYGLKNHIEFLNKIITQCKYKSEVWLTEFGNINPYNEELTTKFMEEMLNYLETTSIKRWYYFQASENDPKFNAIVEQKDIILKGKLFYYLCTPVLRIPAISKFVNWGLRKINSPTIKDIDYLIKTSDKYLDNLPQQAMEPNGKLNSIGAMYINKATKVYNNWYKET